MNAKDLVVPQNWRNFVEGNANYLAWKHKLKEIPAFVLEQVLLRAYVCRDCLIAKKCTVCKCGAPNLFFSPHKVDSKDRWAKWHGDVIGWLNEKRENKDWQEFEQILAANNVSLDDSDIFNFIKSIPIQPDKRDKPAQQQPKVRSGKFARASQPRKKKV